MVGGWERVGESWTLGDQSLDGMVYADVVNVMKQQNLAV